MDDQGELFTDYGPEKPRRLSRGWIIAIAVGVVFALIMVTNDDTETDAPSSRGSSASEDRDQQSGLACRHFRNIAGDADVLTDTEIREKLKEVHDDANIATPQVQTASRQALSAITSRDMEGFEAAVQSLDRACTSAGW